MEDKIEEIEIDESFQDLILVIQNYYAIYTKKLQDLCQVYHTTIQNNIENKNNEDEKQILDQLVMYDRIKQAFEEIEENLEKKLNEEKSSEHLQYLYNYVQNVYSLITLIKEDTTQFVDLCQKYKIQYSDNPKFSNNLKALLYKDIEQQDRDKYSEFIKEQFSNQKIEIEEDRDSNWTDNQSDMEMGIEVIDDKELADVLDEDIEEEDDEQEEDKIEETESKKEETKVNYEQIVKKFNDEDQSDKKFQFHKQFVSCIDFNEKNQTFATGGGDDLSIIWNFENENPLNQFSKNKETVDCVKFSSDGQYFAEGCLDGTINIYNTKNYQLKCKPEGPTDEIRFLEWHPKGNLLVAGSADSSCWIWNGLNGELLNSFYHEDGLTCGGFSSDGKLLITASEDRTIRVWKPMTGEQQKKISGFGFHEGIILCMDIHKLQQIIVSGSEDSSTCLSNYETGKILGKIDLENPNASIESVLFTNKLDLIACGSRDENCRIYDIQKLSQREIFKLDGGIIKMKQLDNLIICATLTGRIYIFDYRQKESLKYKKGGGVLILDFTIANENIVATYDDGSIKSFELKKF